MAPSPSDARRSDGDGPSPAADTGPRRTSRLGSGDGPPAVVLPGGPCRGPEYLGDLAGLGDVRSLLVLHPRSAPGTGGLSRGWWQDADDVVALADALGQDRIDVVAHSAGTRLALATATRFPDRVRTMALVTPPAAWLSGTEWDGPAIAARRADPAVAAALRSMTRPPASTEDGFQEALRIEAPACYARWTDVERAHAGTGSTTRAAVAAWFAGIPADVAEQILAAPLPPTLVVGGAEDVITGDRPVRDYARALGAELVVVDRCGHYPWVEQPEAFRAALAPWLRAAVRRP